MKSQQIVSRRDRRGHGEGWVGLNFYEHQKFRPTTLLNANAFSVISVREKILLGSRRVRRERRSYGVSMRLFSKSIRAFILVKISIPSRPSIGPPKGNV